MENSQDKMAIDTDASLRRNMSNVPLGLSTESASSGQCGDSSQLDARDGPNPSGTVPLPSRPSKRRRKTKAETALCCTEQERNCLRKEQERQLEKLVQDQEKTAWDAARRRNSKSSQSMFQSAECKDRGKTFVQEDYENAMTYLEDSKNYTALFGDGSKTSVGTKQLTKSAAFEVFATWMNQLNPRLLLNGRGLRQRINRWKKKYTDTRTFEQTTGAGIESSMGPRMLHAVLEVKCPCFHRLDALFQDKANVTSLCEFDQFHLDAGPSLLPERSDDKSDGVEAPVAMEESCNVDAENVEASQSASQAHPKTPVDANPPTNDDNRSVHSKDDEHGSLDQLGISAQSGTTDLVPQSNVQTQSQANESHQPLPNTSNITPTPTAGRSHIRAEANPTQRSRSKSTKASPAEQFHAAPPPIAPKISLAAAFANARDSRFRMLESQISLEQSRLDKESMRLEREESRAKQREAREERREAREDDKWEQQLNWERERYYHEEARLLSREAKDDRLRQEKREMVLDLLRQGKSANDVEVIMRLIYS